MKIALIGATGRTGDQVLRRAIARGQHVTAIVRSLGNLEPSDFLTVIEGDVFDPDFLATSICGHEVVISTLARGRQRQAILTDSTAAMIAAFKHLADAPRYIVISQGLLFESTNPLVHILRRFLRATIADSAGMETLILASDIDWTIVRPPRLTASLRVLGHSAIAGARPNGPAAMSRADLAEFLLDEAASRMFKRSIVGVTSR